jgi:hypothetical protein
MTVKKYINDMIDKHQEEFGVDFDIYVCDTIEKHINNGVYAFQVIYNGHNQVHEIKNLNYSLLKSEKRENTVGGYWLVWSYDNGVRYQWSDSETLVFDPSIIRNIKLNQILN